MALVSTSKVNASEKGQEQKPRGPARWPSGQSAYCMSNAEFHPWKPHRGGEENWLHKGSSDLHMCAHGRPHTGYTCVHNNNVKRKEFLKEREEEKLPCVVTDFMGKCLVCHAWLRCSLWRSGRCSDEVEEDLFLVNGLRVFIRSQCRFCSLFCFCIYWSS